MDPFRPGGMGSTGGGMFGPPPHPGQLPRLFHQPYIIILFLYLK